jgi:hypothetical protein
MLASLPSRTPQRVDPTDHRARRQWRKVRDADRVIQAYREFDGALKLHVHRDH